MDLRLSLRRLAAACVFGVGAMVVCAEPAAAQDTACPAFVPPPALVDGATASQGQMESTHQAYTAWAAARVAALDCYRAQIEPVVAANNVRRAAHDGGADYLNTVSALWRSQVDTFNARTGGPDASAAPVQMPAAPAADQSTECPALEPAAQMQAGASATRAQIDAYNAQYTAWGTGFRAALDCRARAVQALDAQMQPLVAAYNTGSTELGERNTAWQTEINEFTARTPERAARPAGDEPGD